jgi:ParB family chromosome partitioning protein
VVVDDDDLRAELVMIDENLVRSELVGAERAKQTARRKEIYETLHPETKQGQ